MVHKLVLCAYVTVKIAMVYSRPQDMFYSDSNTMVIGNLKKREVIPLNPYFSPYRRRYGQDPQNELNYRRTKDIREEFVDRRFELTESQIREAKLDNKENLEKLHNELRWLAIDDDEGIDQQQNMLLIEPR
ncbi:uncharacterized protein LOC110371482 [Helicoverpa armigera]|uniref:uncharacterized protein LOC110371482 n=1 Tax=Helicoverpa armigera TaxID=29058 RepID=UPI000B37316C|nr:uncharacterized protein LOC110371482 [Helicoverpa armigera]XP_047033884.1 uncharacterized protein LOC124640244 [Helicoverpa zea]